MSLVLHSGLPKGFFLAFECITLVRVQKVGRGTLGKALDDFAGEVNLDFVPFLQDHIDKGTIHLYQIIDVLP